MFEIIGQNTSRFFTLEQAQDLLPLVYRLTEDSAKQAKYLMACIEALPDKKSERAQELQNQVNDIINKWQNKLERLGAKPKGLWLADFDNGDGYFCWKFPEVKIMYRHGYQDGFTGRMMIESDEDSHAHSHSPN